MSHREAGFTLIELLVAFAVFSIAALALLRLEGATIKSTAEVETRTLGQIVAQNVAVETLTDPVAPSIGETRGTVTNGGREWRWSRITRRTEDVRIVRIEIMVRDASGKLGGALSLARAV